MQVKFRFDLGSGSVTLKSSSKVAIDRWHTVYVAREGKVGHLKLDDDEVTTKEAPGEFRGLELDGPLYVGGTPRSVNLPRELRTLGQDSGFYGNVVCFVLDRISLDLQPVLS